MMFDAVVFLVSVFAAAVASVAGFGVGSLLTPLLSLAMDTKIAVAVVAVPHMVATGIRFWLLRRHVDKRVLLSFGIASAAGGLIGALLHAKFAAPALTVLFGGVLVFSGFMGMTGWSDRLRFHGAVAWFAGGLSGLLGGLVGNQGGIRSAGLLGFDVPRHAFVATATAVGLIVDAVRMPVYFWTEGSGIFQNSRWVVLAVLGAAAGTPLGLTLLKRLPERIFRRAVSGLIFLLGAVMLVR